MSADLSLVIPFYNEEENVSAVIAEARGVVPGAEIIAVDDGSRDRTPALLDGEKDIRVIHFPKNLGQGPALYAGLLSEYAGTVVTVAEAWHAYRHQMLTALAMWTITLRHDETLPDMQPEDMSLAMIERIATAVDDLDTLALFDERA